MKNNGCPSSFPGCVETMLVGLAMVITLGIMFAFEVAQL